MKRLRVILLFLLLGAIVNVAVAWGIALAFTIMPIDINPHDANGYSVTNDDVWRLGRDDEFGTNYYYSFRYRIAPPDEIEMQQIKDLSSDYPIESVKPNWGSMDIPGPHYGTLTGREETLIEKEFRIFEARGWPIRSFWCLRTYLILRGNRITNSYDPEGLFSISRLAGSQAGPRGIPFYPIWTGFVINTIFYALLLWMPLITRRMIRRRRGLCVKCAYDLRGVDHQACPECGEEIRKGNPA